MREHTLDQRLLDERGPGVQTTVMNDCVARITGHKNNLCSWTTPFNFSRNPTLSMPGGDGKGGPPPSLQLVGRLLGEATLIRAGAAYERATEWHKQRPSA